MQPLAERTMQPNAPRKPSKPPKKPLSAISQELREETNALIQKSISSRRESARREQSIEIMRNAAINTVGGNAAKPVTNRRPCESATVDSP